MEENQVEIEDQELVPDSSGTIPQTPGVTREDLAEFASQIGNQVAQAVAPPQSYEPEEDYVDPNNFASVEALNSHLSQREQRMRQEILAQVQAQMAPSLIMQGTQNITNGMNDVEKQCFQEQLNTIPAEMRANAVSDPTIAGILKNAAIGAAVLKGGGHIPSSNDPASRESSTSVSSEDRTDIANLMKTFNVTEKRAKELVASAKKEVGR